MIVYMFQIEYFTTNSGRSLVEDMIETQDAKSRDKIYEVIDYLIEYGFHLPTTYLRRMSGTKMLWELRAKYQSKQYRIFLARITDRKIVFLHMIVKKTAKTPHRDIDTAEERLNAYLKGGK